MRSRQKPTLPLRYLFLLSDAELLDDCSVSFDINSLKVVKKISSVTYHLKKTATAVMVVVVVLEVFIKRIDSVSENSDLNFRRTCVTFVDSIFSNDSLLFVFQDHDCFHLSKKLFNAKHSHRRVKHDYCRLIFPKTEPYVIQGLF